MTNTSQLEIGFITQGTKDMETLPKSAEYLNFEVQFGPSLNFKAGNVVISKGKKIEIPSLLL